MGASRIDRIYTTKEMSDKKIGLETVAAPFTDHLSAVMRLSVDVPIVRRGKGFWKMNTSILSEEVFEERLRQKWTVWRQQRRWPMWWGRYTKKTDSYFLYSGRVRTSAGLREVDNFLYGCIYDILRNTYPHEQKITMPNRLKAKITSLHGDKLQRVMLDNDEPNRLAGERPALFHILQMRKRQEARMI